LSRKNVLFKKIIYYINFNSLYKIKEQMEELALTDYPSPAILAAIRKWFPVTRHKIYLNHAGCSPYSAKVHQAMSAYINEAYGPVVEDYPKNLSTREALRSLIGKLINAPADYIGFVKNTSSGLSVLASGLKWSPGDRIILADCEFPSNIYPFLNLKPYGVLMDFIPSRAKFNGFIDVDYIQSLITPTTRLIALSFVEFANGFRNDLETIGDLCRQNGILFSVDGIQGLGALPLDVGKCNIHFLSCATHKWLMGPQGMAFIYVHPDLTEKITMTQVGWLSVKDAWDFFDYRLELLDGARRFETGTENWPGIYGTRAAVSLLMETGIEKIEQHILCLTDRLLEGLCGLGLKTLSSTEPGRRSGIVSFVFPGPHQEEKTDQLFRFLNRKNIITAFRDNSIRISPHFYNTTEDMDAVIDAVREFTERKP